MDAIVGGGTTPTGGVAGLVSNCSNEASLDKVQPLLDAEMKPKCNLYCTPCHISRKPQNRARLDESLE